MAEVDRDLLASADYDLPAVPASASALIFDEQRRLLILRPTYKSGWTIPGGVIESDGETPWQACRREVREECGLEVTGARLACVDFRPPRPGRPGGIRFLFNCDQLAESALRAVTLQRDEIAEFRVVPVEDALLLLRKPIRRRVRAAVRRDGRARRRGCVYLEDGRPVSAVSPAKPDMTRD
jgi:8-oxo-dGTP pyrophosphatase MutT (NUDIX family)